jgi:hypothetical protein
MRYLTILLFATSCLAQTPTDSIRKVLDDQVTAWNRGDIDTFMAGYDNSPHTAFIGKSIQRGWENVRKNYHERYPTTDAMGKLDLSSIEVNQLAGVYSEAAAAVGVEGRKLF